MNITIEKNEKYNLVKVNEEKLTSAISPELKAQILFLHTQDYKSMIVDLTNVQYCDSSGLSAILVGNRLCREANLNFILVGVQDHVRKLITISQLGNVLSSIPTLTEAIDYIHMEDVEKQLNKEH
jgi:anti-sigma B factor antagonist